ncbi:MAG: hypothetical protein ACEQSK_08860 [Sphingomonadaceae bacterium]
MSDFQKYFKANMEALGLPAPDTLFSSAQTAVGTVTILLSHIDKFGKTITVGEVVGAATKLEKLGVVATLSASFYAGACVGSIAVASERSLADGISLADVLAYARSKHLSRPWLTAMLHRAPAIYRPHGSAARLRRAAAVAQ